MKIMKPYPDCSICGEYHLETLLIRDRGIYCYNCSPTYTENRPIGACYRCKKVDVPCERHHVYSRIVSGVTVTLCCNCHRIVSASREKFVEICKAFEDSIRIASSRTDSISV
jgi:hypothetical protein